MPVNMFQMERKFEAEKDFEMLASFSFLKYPSPLWAWIDLGQKHLNSPE